MLSVIREGVEYSINDGNLARFIGQDGFGMAPAHRLQERGPLQHGDTDKGFRLDPRIGRIVLQMTGENHDELYQKRQQLLALFAPSDLPLSLKWDIDTGRQIDVHYIGDLSYSSSDRKGYIQNTVVTLKASDPAFYDPARIIVTFSLGGGADTFAVPMSVPHNVGASAANWAQAIQYAGNWDEYPEITIYGPITDALIENLTTGEKLDFDGTTIATGDYYVIDLRYGYKTVMDDSGVNKISTVTEDSDLATFHLERGPGAAGLLAPLSNSIRITGTSIDANTRVDLKYYNRYLGI